MFIKLWEIINIYIITLCKVDKLFYCYESWMILNEQNENIGQGIHYRNISFEKFNWKGAILASWRCEMHCCGKVCLSFCFCDLNIIISCLCLIVQKPNILKDGLFHENIVKIWRIFSWNYGGYKILIFGHKISLKLKNINRFK